MDIKVEKMKEMEDGSAIVWLEMDLEAKDFFIGEGFLAVLKRSIGYSDSYVKPEENENVKRAPKKKTKRSKQ